MAEIEIEAKTVEDAIQDGLTKLGISREKVDIKILNDGSAGLFGLKGNKPARVRLVTKTGIGGTDDAVLDYPLAEKTAIAVVFQILTLMEVSFSDVAVSLMAGRITVAIKSDESALLIGKTGQTIDALEHIVNLMLSKDPTTRVKVTIDIDRFRGRQEEKLHTIAAAAAAEVKRSGTIYRFDPMSSVERRIIHVYLQADTEIETASEGDGSFRRVVIKPKNTP